MLDELLLRTPAATGCQPNATMMRQDVRHPAGPLWLCDSDSGAGIGSMLRLLDDLLKQGLSAARVPDAVMRHKLLVITHGIFSTFRGLDVRGHFVQRVCAALLLLLVAQTADGHGDRALCPAAVNISRRERKGPERKATSVAEGDFIRCYREWRNNDCFEWLDVDTALQYTTQELRAQLAAEKRGKRDKRLWRPLPLFTCSTYLPEPYNPVPEEWCFNPIEQALLAAHDTLAPHQQIHVTAPALAPWFAALHKMRLSHLPPEPRAVTGTLLHPFAGHTDRSAAVRRAQTICITPEEEHLRDHLAKELTTSRSIILIPPVPYVAPFYWIRNIGVVAYPSHEACVRSSRLAELARSLGLDTVCNDVFMDALCSGRMRISVPTPSEFLEHNMRPLTGFVEPQPVAVFSDVRPRGLAVPLSLWLPAHMDANGCTAAQSLLLNLPVRGPPAGASA